MKRAAALGLSAPLVGILMSAQAVGAQDATPSATDTPTPAPPTGEWGSTIVMPEVSKAFSGSKLTTILDNDGPGKPFETVVVQKFSEASGVEINNVSAPTSTTDRLAQYQQFLAAQASEPDVMMIDVIHPGILAQHAIDLSDVLNGQPIKYFERIVQNNTVNGILVGVPFFTDAALLYFRTDLLQKYGYEKGPETWTELEEMSKKIQDGERAANPDFQGFVWQGNAYEGLTCDALEWQGSNGGGEIIDADGNVTLNNDKGIASFERAKAWIGNITPEGVTTYGEEEARGVWQAGNSAMMRNWPYCYSLGQAADSAVKDKFDVSPLPMGDGDGARHAATLGGWQLMVSKYSKNQDAAKEFVKYITSPQILKSYAIERSLFPSAPDIYSDQDVLAANPFMGKLLDVFENAVARPSTPSGDLYGNISTIYFTGVNQILTGQKDAKSAVEQMAKDMEDVMAQL